MSQLLDIKNRLSRESHILLSDNMELSGLGQHRLYFFCLALCGEAGESANIAKKIWRGLNEETISASHGKLKIELIDVISYALLALAEISDEDPLDILERKRAVLYERWPHIANSMPSEKQE